MALLLLYLAGAVAPAAFALHLVYVRDKYEREPLSLVLRVYFVSFLTVIPAIVLETIGSSWLDASDPNALLYVALLSFVVVGIAEEGSKFLFLRWLAYRRAFMDEVYDGILYAVAVSLGFATVENIAYVFANPAGAERVAVIITRAVLPVPLHALLGVVMGYYVGRAKFTPTAGARRRLLLIGLFLASFAHGLYDFAFLSIDEEVAGGAAPLFVFIGLGSFATLWLVAVRLIHLAQAQSPFKRPSPLSRPLAAFTPGYKFCTQCGARAPRTDRFCRRCGASWTLLVQPPVPPPSLGSAAGGSPEGV